MLPEPPAPVDPDGSLVVATAIVHGGRVLAARRLWPEHAAGRWEFPGGRVEPGETCADAVVRECREELSLQIRVLGWARGSSPIRPGLELVLCFAEPVEGVEGLRLVDHDEYRWLTPDGLEDLDWLGPDLPFLSQVGEHLSESAR